MAYTLRELLTELNHLALKDGFDLDQEVVIGHYNQNRELTEDLDLCEVSWLFLSSDDKDKPNSERKKVVELCCYEQVHSDHCDSDTCTYYDS